MFSDHGEIPAKVLDDLCSRFIINIPSEQRDDAVRVLFAVESAHWFYIDFYYNEDNQLPECHIKDFAQQIFQHCPFLRDKLVDLDESFTRWRDYKYSVPTYGAVLIDPSYEYILLVQGYHNRESWGFPKGKVQENESALKCAIREVMEEVGFDMKDRASEDQYLERELNGQIIRLYIVTHVPLETKFAAKTKGEIKEMRWFPIADLPAHRRDTTCQVKLNLTAKAFFMVIPFIKDLRRWINSESHHHHQNIRPRHRANTQIPITSSNPYSNTTIMDKQSNPPVLQRQRSVQDTIQRHFSQILKNDSITVTDQTSMTETLMKQENNPTTYFSRGTPPSNAQCHHSNNEKCEETLLNGNFSFKGPSCWTKFRLDRSQVFLCLSE